MIYTTQSHRIAIYDSLAKGLLCVKTVQTKTPTQINEPVFLVYRIISSRSRDGGDDGDRNHSHSRSPDAVLTGLPDRSLRIHIFPAGRIRQPGNLYARTSRMG